MKILILASSFSGLCQRVLRELTLDGHQIAEHYGMDIPRLKTQLQSFNPELIICPFLTHRIPSDIWKKYKCLVVHPGIEGDRGASSLDWAISGGWDYWGVTLLEAVEEMDAGDIWGTREFPLRTAGKTSIYKREVSSAAVELIKEAITNAGSQTFQPRPLNYSNPNVKGRCQDFMRQADRKINWRKDTTQTVLNKLNAGDTSPGVLDEAFDYPVHLFGAIKEERLRGRPGEWLAIAYGSACRATVDGAVWIRQLKCQTHESLPAIKLPAQQVLSTLLDELSYNRLCLCGASSETPNDIRVERVDQAAYIYFDFYNGACSTEQCQRLQKTIAEVKQQDVKTLVLMGGEDFFSNGIHLNCIEAAPNAADESWHNINAIDDVVNEIINTPNQITIAALRNNAGAGGAILALACDHVVARDGVVLNPHYKNMGLYGSEYWTYLLPKRAGSEEAMRIANECQPMLAKEAYALGLADLVLPENWQQYHKQLQQIVDRVSYADDYHSNLELKASARARDEAQKPLASYRAEELNEMRRNFYSAESHYHHERRMFVYKGKIPGHLLLEESA